jgi:hypothetical protein
MCSHDPIIFDGKDSIKWSALSQALFAWLLFSPKFGPRSQATMFVLFCECMRNRYLDIDETHASLPELSLALRNIPAHCTDPRDFVHVAYSIANCPLSGQPPKGLPVAEYQASTVMVYNRASELMNVLSGQPLSLSLSDGTQSSHSSFSLSHPSWSTNWETRTKRYLLNRIESGFSASRRLRCEQSSMHVLSHLELAHLRCTGRIVDSIRRTSDYLPPRRHCDHYILEDNCFFFVNWYEFAQENSRLAEDTNLLHYADTIQARGCGHLWEDTQTTPQDRVQKARTFLDFLSNEDTKEADVTNSIRLFHAACFPSHDRRFAVTRKGRFCLVPGATKGGDLVCILRNSRVPYILRPRTDGDGYQNIGEAYVHGIMHGEISDGDGFVETEFVLY